MIPIGAISITIIIVTIHNTYITTVRHQTIVNEQHSNSLVDLRTYTQIYRSLSLSLPLFIFTPSHIHNVMSLDIDHLTHTHTHSECPQNTRSEQWEYDN